MTRNYYLLLSGYFISTAGDWLYQIALPLLVYQITGSPLSMAVTYGLTYLPVVLFLPFGGVIADRIDRRRLLVWGDLAAAALVGLLALAAWQSVHTIWLVYPTVFVLASITSFYHPAFQSFVPSLVDDPQLARANSWLSGAENVVVFLGPLVAGLAIAALGTTSALFLDAVSFGASGLLILRISAASRAAHAEVQAADAGPLWLDDIREAAAFVWRDPLMRYGSLLFLGVNFAIGLFTANYVYFLSEVLGLAPFQIGLAFAIPGLGAILGALSAPLVERRLEPGRLLLLGTVVSGLAMLPMLVAHEVFAVAVPWAIVSGLGSLTAVTWFTVRQRVVPPRLLGRAVALTRLVAFAALPLAAVVGGLLLDATRSMSPIIGVAAAISVAIGGLGFLTPLHRPAANRMAPPDVRPTSAGQPGVLPPLSEGTQC
jgi:MFS family permease